MHAAEGHLEHRGALHAPCMLCILCPVPSKKQDLANHLQCNAIMTSLFITSLNRGGPSLLATACSNGGNIVSTVGHVFSCTA